MVEKEKTGHRERLRESFLRSKLRGKGLIVFSNLEMLFAYHLELNLLRTMAADDDRILLLLPGRRGSGKIIMFRELEGGNYTLPTNLIASDHLWELRERRAQDTKLYLIKDSCKCSMFDFEK